MPTDLDRLFTEWGRRAGELPLADAPTIRLRGQRRRRARRALAALGSVVLVVAITAVGWGLTRGEHRPAPRPQPAAPAPSASPVRFTPLRHLGSVPVPPGWTDARFPDATQAGPLTAVLGDRAFVAWLRIGGALHVGAVDLTTLRPVGQPVLLGSYSELTGLLATPGALVVIARHTGGTGYALLVVDPQTSQLRWQRDFDIDDGLAFYDSVLVIADRGTKSTVGLDLHSGNPAWTVHGDAVQTFPAVTARDLSAGADVPTRSDNRLLQVTADGELTIYDPATGTVLGRRSGVGTGGATDQFLAYENRLYVVRDEHPYRLSVYPLDPLGPPRTVYNATDRSQMVTSIEPCGHGAVCLLQTPDPNGDLSSNSVVAIDPATGTARWRAAAPGAYELAPVGDRVAALTGGSYNALYDAAGHQLLTDADQTAQVLGRVNAASLLLLTQTERPDPTDLFTNPPIQVVGVRADDGSRTVLGTVPGDELPDSCSWSQQLLICPGRDSVEVWRYASG